MPKTYDNLISTAINSVTIGENDVKVVYNSNKDKEYTYKCENIDQFNDEFIKVLIGIELRNENASIGKFLHNQIKEGLIVESKQNLNIFVCYYNQHTVTMSKSYNQSNNPKYQEFNDDFEDFGYKVKNIRRQSKKKVAKFKDRSDYFEDSF